MPRRLTEWLSLICVILMLAGCSENSKYYESSFFIMDTVATIRLSMQSKTGDRLDRQTLSSVVHEAECIAKRIENAISRTIPESETSRWNDSAEGIISDDADFLSVVADALRIAEATSGAYSPAVGTLTELWDVSGGGHVPAADEIQHALLHTDYRSISLEENALSKKDAETLLDFGGIGKGYAAQRIVDYLNSTDVSWGLVSIGGNVGVFGKKTDQTAYKIGITDPDNTAAVAGYLTVPDGFVSVSGDYERYFIADGVRYHHIFDPDSGYPASSGIRSAAVWCINGTQADALSTALFVMGAEGAAEYYLEHPETFEAILITDANEIILTPGLTDKFSLSDSGKYTLS